MAVIRAVLLPLVAACVAVATVSCTHLPDRVPDSAIQQRLAAAEDLTARGCYRCLKDAAAIYDELLGPSSPAVTTIAQTAHDTYMLLALRELELGIPDSGGRGRAHRLPGITNRRSHEVCERLLSALAARSGDHIVVSHGEDELSPDHRNVVVHLQAGWRHSIVQAYTYVALDCALSLSAGLQPDLDAVLAQYPQSGALRYRRLICTTPFPHEAARALVSADPGFAEVLLAIAQHTIGQRTIVSTYGDLHRAFEAIPESRLIGLNLAGLALGLSRYEEALRYYDHVLTQAPDRDAQLGRVKALTHLKRHREAIATLDQLLLDPSWSPGEKYYWRAVNQLHLSAPDRAYDDALAAQRSWPGSPVHRLAGMAALTLGRLTDARHHLQAWHEMEKDDCEGLLYLGYLESAEKEWSPALQRFTGALTCYEKSVEELSAVIQTLRADRSAQSVGVIEGVTAVLSEAKLLQVASIYNAAVAAKMIGKRQLALDLAKRVLGDAKYGSLAKDFILDIDLIGSSR